MMALSFFSFFLFLSHINIIIDIVAPKKDDGQHHTHPTDKKKINKKKTKIQV